MPGLASRARPLGLPSRWFRSSGRSSHSHLRTMMSRDALESYRATGRPLSKQDEVWREVSRKLEAMDSVSASDALDQAYEDHSSRLEEVLQKARMPEDCCGVVFAFGGRIAGMDLFDKPSTLSKLLPKLVKAYAIDALEHRELEKTVDREAVAKWLRSAQEATCEPFDSPGLGCDVRIEARQNLIGAGLVVDDQPVHVELFPVSLPGSKDERRDSEW
ncbi:MAG: ARPP-1 family domain-containing protein [Phycisphaerae bacterium]